MLRMGLRAVSRSTQARMDSKALFAAHFGGKIRQPKAHCKSVMWSFSLCCAAGLARDSAANDSFEVREIRAVQW